MVTITVTRTLTQTVVFFAIPKSEVIAHFACSWTSFDLKSKRVFWNNKKMKPYRKRFAQMLQSFVHNLNSYQDWSPFPIPLNIVFIPSSKRVFFTSHELGLIPRLFLKILSLSGNAITKPLGAYLSQTLRIIRLKGLEQPRHWSKT